MRALLGPLATGAAAAGAKVGCATGAGWKSEKSSSREGRIESMQLVGTIVLMVSPSKETAGSALLVAGGAAAGGGAGVPKLSSSNPSRRFTGAGAGAGGGAAGVLAFLVLLRIELEVLELLEGGPVRISSPPASYSSYWFLRPPAWSL